MKRPPRDMDLSSRRIARRALVLGAAQMGFAGLLGWQMRRMQVEDAEEYRMLAEENRINIRLIPPARGEIFDRTLQTQHGQCARRQVTGNAAQLDSALVEELSGHGRRGMSLRGGN